MTVIFSLFKNWSKLSEIKFHIFQSNRGCMLACKRWWRWWRGKRGWGGKWNSNAKYDEPEQPGSGCGQRWTQAGHVSQRADVCSHSDPVPGARQRLGPGLHHQQHALLLEADATQRQRSRQGRPPQLLFHRMGLHTIDDTLAWLGFGAYFNSAIRITGAVRFWQVYNANVFDGPV